jgi:hypothetical protein
VNTKNSSWSGCLRTATMGTEKTELLTGDHGGACARPLLGIGVWRRGTAGCSGAMHVLDAGDQWDQWDERLCLAKGTKVHGQARKCTKMHKISRVFFWSLRTATIHTGVFAQGHYHYGGRGDGQWSRGAGKCQAMLLYRFASASNGFERLGRGFLGPICLFRVCLQTGARGWQPCTRPIHGDGFISLAARLRSEVPRAGRALCRGNGIVSKAEAK